MWKPKISRRVRTKQGRYRVIHPDKYLGNPKNVVYRSSWEKAVCVWCDMSPQVVKWGSEEVVIPYYYHIDRKFHSYFVDFVIKIKVRDGIETLLVDVKPDKQT